MIQAVLERTVGHQYLWKLFGNGTFGQHKYGLVNLKECLMQFLVDECLSSHTHARLLMNGGQFSPG